MMIRRVAAVLAAAALLAGCSAEEPDRTRPSANPGAEWPRTEPGQAGFDPNALRAIDRRLQESNSSCFVVVRDGKLVHDSYFRGTGENSAAAVYSITKSFTSVLVGMAEDDGDLSIDDRASKYIPEWRGTPSADVTIRDLLTNTSGRHWDLTADYAELALAEPDKTTFALGLGQDVRPGQVWQYNNAAVQALQPVLEKATGVEPADYGQQRIFDALGMRHSHWTTDEVGNTVTFSGINSTCLDLARFGQLMLNGGTWNGRRLIPEAFVDEATGGSSSALNAAYGLLWWVNDEGVVLDAGTGVGQKRTGKSRLAPRAPDDTFWALGAGKQMIAVVPSENIVVVRMGAAPDNPANLTPDSLTGDVIDALR